jgi:hypothetical protein
MKRLDMTEHFSVHYIMRVACEHTGSGGSGVPWRHSRDRGLAVKVAIVVLPAAALEYRFVDMYNMLLIYHLICGRIIEGRELDSR